jgi:hypothetical protein
MTDAEFDEYLKQTYNGVQDAVTASSEGADAEDIQKEEAKENNITEPFKVFNSEDEYRADRQKFFDEHIGDRLKNAREDSEFKAQIESFAKDFYRGSENPLEALLNDLRSQSAQALGMSAENYKEYSEDRRDALIYRAQMEQERMRAAAREETINRWKAEESRLKASVPDFDFAKAMENETYRELVQNGMSLDAAYYKMMLDEKNASMQQQRRPITQNAASRGTKSGSSVNDMMNMSEDKFLKEIHRMMEG